jgi:hypothetical protein
MKAKPRVNSRQPKIDQQRIHCLTHISSNTSGTRPRRHNESTPKRSKTQAFNLMTQEQDRLLTTKSLTQAGTTIEE